LEQKAMCFGAVLRIVGVGIAAAFAAEMAAADEKPKAEIVPQLGHSATVSSVAIAPDGKTALSGSWDHTLRLWDLASGREIKKFEGHSGWVNSVAFAPDGKTALSGSNDNTLRLWDLASGREIKTLEGHRREVLSVAIAPDGKNAL
jgi:WD40 repeat protein